MTRLTDALRSELRSELPKEPKRPDLLLDSGAVRRTQAKRRKVRVYVPYLRTGCLVVVLPLLYFGAEYLNHVLGGVAVP
jgi:hypothetical protein